MNWLRQTPDKPLFPDILWSRPENKRFAGKLLIIGGHKQEFNDVSAAYTAALKAGAGAVRVILPDSLQKMLHKLFREAEYAASNQIGSFSRQALGSLLDAAEWADAVLFAGDLGKNSETSLMMEGFVEKYRGKMALAGDSIDYFLNNPKALISRDNTLLIAGLPQLQKLAAPSLIQQNADLIKIVEQVSSWVSGNNLAAITVQSERAVVAYKDQVSTTPVQIKSPDANLAAYATVWWLQQPEKPFDAISTSICCYVNK
jgi:hypothetical protein